MVGEEGLTLRLDHVFKSVAFSPDGQRLACVGTKVVVCDATPRAIAAAAPAITSEERTLREGLSAIDRFVAEFPCNPHGRFNAANKRNELGIYLNDKCGKPAEAN